jgi:hypothetical protein
MEKTTDTTWEEDEVFWGQRRSLFFSPEKTIDGKDN